MKFSTNEVSFQVGEIIKFTIILFFFLGVGMDEFLVRLLLIEQIIKDVNTMSIFFSVKHPQSYISGKKEFAKLL